MTAKSTLTKGQRDWLRRKNDPVYRAKQREYNRKYARSERGRAERLRSGKIARTRNPEAAHAQSALQDKVRRGIVQRPATCERCGTVPAPGHDGRSSVQAHHPDYSRPLEVVWLCPPCHQGEHRCPTS